MNKETKFKLEGEIEEQGSWGSDNRVRKKRKNYKPALLLFILLTLGFLATSVVFWMKSRDLSQSQSADEQKSDQVQILQDSLQFQSAEMLTKDSLNEALKQRIARLQEFSTETDGIFFEVQVGNFKDFNLDAYLEEMAHLRQEKHDGRNKLLLGKFRSYKKALLFENDLKRMGLRDVFIKGRIDGRLTSKEEALKVLKGK